MVCKQNVFNYPFSAGLSLRAFLGYAIIALK